ncbi:MAG: T9SS type A sorting domain-containing protein [bacterium]
MKTLITSILLLGMSLISSAQTTNVLIGEPLDSWAPNEPSVCINPKNPDEIIIGANADNYYSSADGGVTWTHGVLASSYGVNCDPVILCDTAGNFYYFHLVPSLSRVVCQKKNGFGSPWTNGSYTALYGTMEIDKEWATFDPQSGNLYASWSRFDKWGSSNPDDSTFIYMAGSTDGGLTWSDQHLVSNIGGNATGGNGSVHGSYPTTGPEGEVYIAWWSPAGLMFDKSTDQGETWLDTDINVTSALVPWIYSLPGIQLGVTFPVINCDRSNGPFRGTIYINWSDKRNGGNDCDVWLVRSTDGGSTWSDPVRVNDDPPDKQQFFSFMTVDQVTGKIYILFYDRRNYSDLNTDVYLAVSEDGGQTFANYKISETPFIPFSTVFFGHYIGISANDDHVFATWMRMDNGELSIWGASIDPHTVGMAQLPAIPVSLSQNSPNPFAEYTFFSFKLEERSEVSLSVIDLLGNHLATLIDHRLMQAGKHVIEFNPEKYNLAPGVYHYSLVTDNRTITKKMIYGK